MSVSFRFFGLCAVLAASASTSWAEVPAAPAAEPAATFAAQVEAQWLSPEGLAQARGAAVKVSSRDSALKTSDDARGAVDGVKDGTWGFHTAAENNPWWQVDLGEVRPLARVLVYNRCDAAGRAAKLALLLSDDGKVWREAYRHNSAVFYGFTDSKPLAISLDGAKARFVRIQLPGNEYLHLDEVEVFGSQDPARNIALGRPADQSSTSQWSAAHGAAAPAHADYPAAEVLERGRRLADDLAAASQESAIKELGVKDGDQVDSGFVFFDGRYIDAPYRVSRRGRNVFVNDVMVYRWDRWPLPDLRVDKDPGLPEGLTEASTFEELRQGGANSHMARKLRYLHQHYTQDVAMEKMLEYYRQLPCVESATRERPDRPGTLVIRMRNGKEVLVDVTPPHPDSTGHWNFGNEALVGQLDAKRSRYETRLTIGDCFFLFSNGEEMSWGRRRAARDLGLVVDILRSDRTKEEKINLLQRMEVLPPPTKGDIDEFTALVTGFKAPPELEQRISRLIIETGVTPRRLKDLPEEIPFERERRLIEEAKKRNESGQQKGISPDKK